MTTITTWGLASVVYWLFAGTFSSHELVTGFLVGGGASALAMEVRRTSRLRFGASWAAARRMLRAVATIPATTARTAVHLGQAIAQGNEPGHVEVSYFRYGATGAKERTRRASAILCASLTPDRFVVTIDRERGTVLLHYIGRPDHEPDPRWLE